MYMYRCESSTDYITVRDGIDEESSVMATYCSSVRDVVITSSGETLSIELVSDEKKQSQGFAAQFAFIAGSSDSATADDRPSPVLPPSGGLVVDETSTTHQLHTGRQQLGGKSSVLSSAQLRRLAVININNNNYFRRKVSRIAIRRVYWLVRWLRHNFIYQTMVDSLSSTLMLRIVEVIFIHSHTI